ncbi:MAG: hypothetical protein U0521_11050 [Anaerolineae bacterium]
MQRHIRPEQFASGGFRGLPLAIRVLEQAGQPRCIDLTGERQRAVAVESASPHRSGGSWRHQSARCPVLSNASGAL